MCVCVCVCVCVAHGVLVDFSQIVTVEQNWNLSTIPNRDGGGAGWDSWMLPFGMLRRKNDTTGICANAPC